MGEVQLPDSRQRGAFHVGDRVMAQAGLTQGAADGRRRLGHLGDDADVGTVVVDDRPTDLQAQVGTRHGGSMASKAVVAVSFCQAGMKSSSSCTKTTLTPPLQTGHCGSKLTFTS